MDEKVERSHASIVDGPEHVEAEVMMRKREVVRH